MSRSELARVYGPHLSETELGYVLAMTPESIDTQADAILRARLTAMERRRLKLAFRRSCDAARAVL